MRFTFSIVYLFGQECQVFVQLLRKAVRFQEARRQRIEHRHEAPRATPATARRRLAASTRPVSGAAPPLNSIRLPDYNAIFIHYLDIYAKGEYNKEVGGRAKLPIRNRAQAGKECGDMSSRMRIAKASILAAALLSFFLSVYLWFNGSESQGIFVGIWVPSILSFGALMFAGSSHNG